MLQNQMAEKLSLLLLYRQEILNFWHGNIIIWSGFQNYSNAFSYVLTFICCYIILKFIKIVIDNEIPDDLTNHIFPTISTRSFPLKQKPQYCVFSHLAHFVQISEDSTNTSESYIKCYNYFGTELQTKPLNYRVSKHGSVLRILLQFRKYESYSLMNYKFYSSINMFHTQLEIIKCIIIFLLNNT